jgi:hypothetical protein
MARPADLRLRVRLELDGRGNSPAYDTVGKLNETTGKVSKTLPFKYLSRGVFGFWKFGGAGGI